MALLWSPWRNGKVKRGYEFLKKGVRVTKKGGFALLKRGVLVTKKGGYELLRKEGTSY